MGHQGIVVISNKYLIGHVLGGWNEGSTKEDLTLRILRGLIGDLGGKFRPNWSAPYVIRELTLEGAAWLTVWGLYLISYSIEHVLLFERCLLGLSLRVCASFPWGLFLLIESLSLCSWRDESFFVRDLSFVRYFVSWIRVGILYRYESWVTFH